MIPPDASEIEQLYRFARVFSENGEEAANLAAGALEEVLPEKFATAHERSLELFSAVWAEARQTAGRAAGLPPFLHGLTPVRRAGCVLHYLLDLPVGEVERLTELTPAELTDILRGCPPEDEARAALQALTLEPERLTLLVQQATAQSAAPGFRLWSPVGVALVFSTLVLVAVLIWTFSGHHAYEDLPVGRKFFLLARQMDVIDGANWEPVDVPAGDLTDWFFVKHHLENMQVPDLLADLPAADCAVQKLEEHPVAVIGLKDARPLLFLFAAADFELEERPAKDWSVFSEGDLAGALQVQNGEACLLVLRGTEAEMRAFLAVPK